MLEQDAGAPIRKRYSHQSESDIHTNQKAICGSAEIQRADGGCGVRLGEASDSEKMFEKARIDSPEHVLLTCWQAVAGI
jgi:hypothetical protein